MAFKKLKQNFNWKYILGEIILIFFGISLAIWFNNWNSSLELNKNKKFAIEKIEEELKNNLEEVVYSRAKNQNIVEAQLLLKKMTSDNSSKIILRPEEMWAFQSKFPRFFRIADSTEVENGYYLYKGSTYVTLEIPKLTRIAWETTRTINIAHKLDYDCLYDLESIYNLQQRLANEIDKASDALQKRELEDMINALLFAGQLDEKLIQDYKDMLKEIENCK